MAKLSDEERALLKRLRDKEQAPDTPPPSVNYSLDLGNDKAYERAIQHGLIDPPSTNGDDDGDDDTDNADDAPRRKGYFGDA